MANQNWKCDVCGYVHTGETAPGVCPVCGVDDTHFSVIEITPVEPKRSASKWRCNVCGYIHEGDAPPQSCPVCSVPKEHFLPLDVPLVEKSTEKVKLVVIGAGIAGLTACETALANENVEVLLISRETVLPYFRLNLTRYLAGEVTGAELEMKPKGFYEQRGFSLVTGDVIKIKRDEKKLILRDGSEYSYDKLILALGAHPFVPSIEGIQKENVFTLRTIQDADTIIEKAGNKKCVIIGGGLLGLEAAGALSKRGCDVSVLEGFGWLLPRQLPKEASLKLQSEIEKEGLAVINNAKSAEIVGDEFVQGVRLEDGRIIEADIVIVSTGVRPNSYLARECGVSVGKGVIVNDTLATNDDAIFAAGDVCEHRGICYGIWPTAYIQGMIAANNALEQQQQFTGMAPSNRLKVLNVDLFSIGEVNPKDGSRHVIDHSTETEFRRFVFSDGVLIGAVLLGDTHAAGTVQEAIDNQVQKSHLPDEITSLL